MEKLIITAAICGAEITREDNSNLPPDCFRACRSRMGSGKGGGINHSPSCKRRGGKTDPKY